MIAKQNYPMLGLSHIKCRYKKPLYDQVQGEVHNK